MISPPVGRNLTWIICLHACAARLILSCLIHSKISINTSVWNNSHSVISQLHYLLTSTLARSRVCKNQWTTKLCWKSIQTMYCYSFYRSRSMLKSVIHPDSSTGTSLICRTCKPTVRIIETVYKARFWIWQPGKKIAFFPLTFIKRFSWKWSYCMQRMTITSQTGSQSSYSWTSFHLLISQKGICNFLGRLLKTSV